MRKPELEKTPENRLRCAKAFAGVDAGIAVSVALPVAPKYQDGQAVAVVARQQEFKPERRKQDGRLR